MSGSSIKSRLARLEQLIAARASPQSELDVFLLVIDQVAAGLAKAGTPASPETIDKHRREAASIYASIRNNAKAGRQNEFIKRISDPMLDWLLSDPFDDTAKLSAEELAARIAEEELRA